MNRKRLEVTQCSLWVFVHTDGSVAYLASYSASSLWKEIIDTGYLGTGHTRASLKKLGWRARRVRFLEF